MKGAGAGFEGRGKKSELNPVLPLRLVDLSGREEGGMRGVAVKCIDIAQKPDCEGSLPGPY